MLKNRSLQVKVVKDEQLDAAVETDRSPRLAEEELQTVKEVISLVGKFYLAKQVLDAGLKIYLRK